MAYTNCLTGHFITSTILINRKKREQLLDNLCNKLYGDTTFPHSINERSKPSANECFCISAMIKDVLHHTTSTLSTSIAHVRGVRPVMEAQKHETTKMENFANLRR